MALGKDEVLDMDTMEVVKVPAAPAAAKEEESSEIKEPAEKEESLTAEEKEKIANAGKQDVPDDDDEDEEKEEEEKDDDEGGEGKKKEKEEEEEEVEEEVAIDDYIKEQFEEKYGITTEEELSDTLDAIQKVEEENEQLRQELEEAKKDGGKPTFASEQEQKAFEFLKKYPITKMGEGAVTFAKLVSMDVDNLPPRVALEEKFILEHEELTREEAMMKFEREYKRKYQVKESDFDSQEEAQAEQKMREIDLKSDAAKAQKFLKKQQEEFKSKVTDKPSDNEPTVQNNPHIQESVKANLSEVDEYIDVLEQINFTNDDDSPRFTYKFTKQQKQEIAASIKAWVGNPLSYDAKGNIKGDYDVESYAIKAAAMLYHDDIVDKAFAAGESLGEIKRADQIASRKPSREAKAVIDRARVPQSEEEQWEAAIAAKKKKPTSKLYR